MFLRLDKLNFCFLVLFFTSFGNCYAIGSSKNMEQHDVVEECISGGCVEIPKKFKVSSEPFIVSIDQKYDSSQRLDKVSLTLTNNLGKKIKVNRINFENFFEGNRHRVIGNTCREWLGTNDDCEYGAAGVIIDINEVRSRTFVKVHYQTEKDSGIDFVIRPWELLQFAGVGVLESSQKNYITVRNVDGNAVSIIRANLLVAYDEENYEMLVLEKTGVPNECVGSRISSDDSCKIIIPKLNNSIESLAVHLEGDSKNSTVILPDVKSTMNVWQTENKNDLNVEVAQEGYLAAIPMIVVGIIAPVFLVVKCYC